MLYNASGAKSLGFTLYRGLPETIILEGRRIMVSFYRSKPWRDMFDADISRTLDHGSEDGTWTQSIILSPAMFAKRNTCVRIPGVTLDIFRIPFSRHRGVAKLEQVPM